MRYFLILVLGSDISSWVGCNDKLGCLSCLNDFPSFLIFPFQIFRWSAFTLPLRSWVHPLSFTRWLTFHCVQIWLISLWHMLWEKFLWAIIVLLNLSDFFLGDLDLSSLFYLRVTCHKRRSLMLLLRWRIVSWVNNQVLLNTCYPLSQLVNQVVEVLMRYKGLLGFFLLLTSTTRCLFIFINWDRQIIPTIEFTIRDYLVLNKLILELVILINLYEEWGICAFPLSFLAFPWKHIWMSLLNFFLRTNVLNYLNFRKREPSLHYYLLIRIYQDLINSGMIFFNIMFYIEL
jgi:hypothetical protein